MAKISQAGLTFNVDALNNPVIKEIVVEKVTAVPNSTIPDTGKVISVVSGLNKSSIGLFSKREEITLTGQYSYLGSTSFKSADYEDDVSEFTAKIEYIVEAIAANSSCTLRLYNFDGNAVIAGSEVSSGTIPVGKKILTSANIVLPVDALIEVWGKKDAGSVDFLSSKINIEKKRKA